MARKQFTYIISDINIFKSKLIYFTRDLDCFCFLDSNSIDTDNTFDFLLAFNKTQELTGFKTPFLDLKHFLDNHHDWLFGYLTYDLKNEIEKLQSNNLNCHFFPKLHFFSPDVLLKVKNNNLTVFANEHYSHIEIDCLLDKINQTKIVPEDVLSIKIQPRVSKSEYIKNINNIKKHLQAGDIYEMNYCQEFYAENVYVDPYKLFVKLNSLSKAPFSSFYRLNQNFCLCASPERFLKKEGSLLTSQPIKGTIKRLANNDLDQLQKKELLNSSKDFSENVMIVDLVRNDFSRFAKKSSVSVDELASVYTYQDVHHLISTISCQIDDGTHIVDVIKAVFPMGSMTGAPKIRAMELIEKYENSFRGLYSGSIGYIKPNQDFDFNVVIRSIFYNQESDYLSFMVGGAITIESDPESEYEECLIKAKSIFKVLNS